MHSDRICLDLDVHDHLIEQKSKIYWTLTQKVQCPLDLHRFDYLRGIDQYLISNFKFMTLFSHIDLQKVASNNTKSSTIDFS